MRLLDEHLDLLPGQLGGVGVLELDAARARRHDLDEVGAAAKLLAHGAADVVARPSASRYMPGKNRPPGAVGETILPQVSSRGPRSAP